MTDKQSRLKADVSESDSCCSKCRRDLSGCIAVFKILLGPKARNTSQCEKEVTKTQDFAASRKCEELALRSENTSREVPEGREVERELKNIGVLTEETENNFDINGWLNMNRTEVIFVCVYLVLYLLTYSIKADVGSSPPHTATCRCSNILYLL